MFDAKRLLDAVVGASARKGSGSGGGLGDILGQILGQPSQQPGQPTRAPSAGQSSGAAGGGDDLIARARDFMSQNQGMTQAALTGLAGLLLTSRKTRGLAVDAAKLGGVALIGALAYKAFRNHQAGKPLLGEAGQPQALTAASTSLPPASSFDPQTISNDDALLYVRAMVAAAASDGHIDQEERTRLVAGMAQAGLDAESTRWLDQELASPADVDELARLAPTPEKGAQVYAAARVAIDPDTLQEREFLRRLQEALGLEAELVSQIDAAAMAIKAE